MKKSILEVVHESANDLYEAGVINAVTMREYDALCLPEVLKLTPRQIKQIRLHEKVSQPILAQYMNVSSSTVKHWEAGEKRPTGAAIKGWRRWLRTTLSIFQNSLNLYWQDMARDCRLQCHFVKIKH